MTPLVALAVAAALHAGFQLCVTVLVYPVLLHDGHRWSERHRAHSRAIVPLVALTYGAHVLAAGWALASRPDSVMVWVATAGLAATVGITALGAAPLHRRLGRGHDPALARALLRVDRARLGAVLLAATAAVAALATV